MNGFVLCLTFWVVLLAVGVLGGTYFIKWLVLRLAASVRQRRLKKKSPVNVLSYHGDVIEEVYADD